MWEEGGLCGVQRSRERVPGRGAPGEAHIAERLLAACGSTLRWNIVNRRGTGTPTTVGRS